MDYFSEHCSLITSSTISTFYNLSVFSNSNPTSNNINGDSNPPLTNTSGNSNTSINNTNSNQIPPLTILTVTKTPPQTAQIVTQTPPLTRLTSTQTISILMDSSMQTSPLTLITSTQIIKYQNACPRRLHNMLAICYPYICAHWNWSIRFVFYARVCIYLYRYIS